MNCSRCHGFMVKDHFLDIQGQFSEMWATSWRCLNCGHVYDAIIEQNRVAIQKILMPVNTEPDYQDEEVHLGAEAFIKKAA
jgi:uncharacterized Zn finger protein